MVENSYEKKSRLIRDNGATRQKTKRGGGQNFEIYRRSTLSTTPIPPRTKHARFWILCDLVGIIFRVALIPDIRKYEVQ